MTPPTAEAVGLLREVTAALETVIALTDKPDYAWTQADLGKRRDARKTLARALSAVPDDGFSPSSPKSEDTHRDALDSVLVPEHLVRFLLGETDIHGFWFGDSKPNTSGRREGFWWRKDLRACLTAPSPSVPTGDAEGAVVAAETWESMAAWQRETFGSVALDRQARRAAEEMDELLADPTDVGEAADVCIVLAGYPGIGEAINRKMAINRTREWRLMGDGTGYHVKPATPAGSE